MDADRLPVPPVGHEQHEWLAEPDGMSSRRQLSAASGPYASTIPARLADYRAGIPSDLSADVDDATAALVQFDAYAAWRLGPESPLLGPMSSVLLRTESASSSQIEQLTAGARQLALAELDLATSENAVTVAGNVRAMEAALDLADRLDDDAVLRMHAALLVHQKGWEEHAGRYRDRLVWVGTTALSPRGASHVAPRPELVPSAMSDLVAFLRRDDLPVLLHAALAHAQFETIHPFVDGNGRVGRALVHAVVRGKGLVRHTTAPISAGLLVETAAYFDALTAFRAGDARPVVERFARAARFAASSGSRLVDDIAAELEASRERLGRLRPQAAAWKVLPYLVAYPVVDARFLVERVRLNGVTAQRALAQLADAGVLVERTGRRRGRVWQHDGILAVLDSYAEGLRRG